MIDLAYNPHRATLRLSQQTSERKRLALQDFHPALKADGMQFDAPAEERATAGMEATDSLRERIVKAEADRDMWRAAGVEERYMEAYFMVEALELQMDQHMQALAQLTPGALRSPERPATTGRILS